MTLPLLVERLGDVMSQKKPQAWFNIRWIEEPWTPEELRKAVEIQTALAWWFAHNEPGTPMPNWCYLSDPIDKAALLELWDEWNELRTE